MISAMPAVAVRREREKNRQGKLIGDPFGRVTYIPGHQLHLPASYYHPHHHHHHNSSNQAGKPTNRFKNNSSAEGNCVTTSTQNNDEKTGLKFLIYSGFGCLAIGLVCLFIGIVTIKFSTQIIGLVFIGLGGLFCVIKVILSGKLSSLSSSSPQETTTRVKTNGNTNDNVDNNSNNLNLITSSVNQPLVDHSRQTIKLPTSPNPMNKSKPTAGLSDCSNQTSPSKSIDQQYLEAS